MGNDPPANCEGSCQLNWIRQLTAVIRHPFQFRLEWMAQLKFDRCDVKGIEVLLPRIRSTTADHTNLSTSSRVQILAGSFKSSYIEVPHPWYFKFCSRFSQARKCLQRTDGFHFGLRQNLLYNKSNTIFQEETWLCEMRTSYLCVYACIYNVWAMRRSVVMCANRLARKKKDCDNDCSSQKKKIYERWCTRWRSHIASLGFVGEYNKQQASGDFWRYRVHKWISAPIGTRRFCDDAERRTWR